MTEKQETVEFETGALDFALPNDDWITVKPPEGSIFLAQHKGEYPRFCPNIGVQLAEIQPESTLRDVAVSLTVNLGNIDKELEFERQIDEAKEQVLQKIDLVLRPQDGQESPEIKLEQWQTVLILHQKDGPRRWALCITLTATVEDIFALKPDYQAFIASGHVDRPSKSGAQKVPLPPSA